MIYRMKWQRWVEVLLLLTWMVSAFGCKPRHEKFERQASRFCKQGESSETHDCVGNHLSSELGRGQYELRDGVRECTDATGKVVSVDDGSTAETPDSEKTIFLRCIFLGGALSACVKHNQCQVMMNYDTCLKELEGLKQTYPQIAGDWQCKKEALPASHSG